MATKIETLVNELKINCLPEDLYEEAKKNDEINDDEIYMTPASEEELIREIKLLQERIDKFVSLKAGSTTGDAELMDLRIDINGNTHNSAGTAVREQIKTLSNDKVTKPNIATVGQAIIVKAVDADGKPIEFEAIDMPSGYITSQDTGTLGYYPISDGKGGVVWKDPNSITSIPILDGHTGKRYNLSIVNSKLIMEEVV